MGIFLKRLRSNKPKKEQIIANKIDTPESVNATG